MSGEISFRKYLVNQRRPGGVHPAEPVRAGSSGRARTPNVRATGAARGPTALNFITRPSRSHLGRELCRGGMPRVPALAGNGRT